MNARRRGVTFVVVLAILAATVSLVAAFSQTQRSASREQASRSERVRARLAAEAGIARALAELSTAIATPGQPSALTDAWATLGAGGGESFTLDNASFRVQITDASARLDLNTATQEALTNLGLAPEQVDSLLDWREASNAPRPLGAKDDYYNNLADPYNTKRAPFQSTDELLLVKGFTPDLLYAADALYQNSTAARPTNSGTPTPPLADLVTAIAYAPNETPTGDGRQNLNGQNVTAQTLQQRLQIPPNVAQTIAAAKATQPSGQFARLSTVLNLPGIQGNATVAGNILDNANTVGATRLEGRVNVNTAPVEVLAALPGVGPDLAQSIVSRQSSSPFTKLSDVLQISSSPTFVASVADSMAVATQSFAVRAVGKAGPTEVALVAFVVVEPAATTTTGTATLRILRIEEAPFGDMPVRWNWAEPTTTTALTEGS